MKLATIFAISGVLKTIVFAMIKNENRDATLRAALLFYPYALVYIDYQIKETLLAVDVKYDVIKQKLFIFRMMAQGVNLFLLIVVSLWIFFGYKNPNLSACFAYVMVFTGIHMVLIYLDTFEHYIVVPIFDKRIIISTPYTNLLAAFAVSIVYSVMLFEDFFRVSAAVRAGYGKRETPLLNTLKGFIKQVVN